MVRQRIKNFLLRHYLNAIVGDDIITLEKGVIKLNQKVITDSELLQLKAEAKALEGFRLWSIMTNSLRYQAQDKIFNKSLNFDDTQFGKAMLYNIGVQESILNLIRNKK